MTEISQVFVVSLKGVCMETTGFRIRREAPYNVKRQLKVIFIALDVNYCYFNAGAHEMELPSPFIS